MNHNMQSTLLLGAIVMIVVFATVYYTSNSTTNASGGSAPDTYNISVVIVGNGEEANQLGVSFEPYVCDVKYFENPAQVQDYKQSLDHPSIVIFTEQWVSNNQETAASQFDDMYHAGGLIITQGNAFDWEKSGLSYSYAPNSTFSGISTIKGFKGLYNVVGSVDYSIGKLLNWTYDIAVEEHEILCGTTSHPLGSGVDVFLDFNSAGYGDTAARTTYYRCEDVSTAYDYIEGDYVTSISPSNARASGLDIQSTMNSGVMLRNGPATTPSNSTCTVNLSIGISESGVSMSVGESWTYTVYDVVTTNQSNTSNNVLKIVNDINESTNTGAGECTVEPGKLVRISEGSTYSGTDTYKAQFCKQYWFGFGAFNDNTQSRTFDITPDMFS